jgi:serine/threonine protein kinase
VDEKQSGSKPPVEVAGYEIIRELGRGGFAVVYLAKQPVLNRTVALKVLTHIDPNDADALHRFEAECQAIGSLSWHPHVVTVYDVGRTADGRPFMAMENLPSGSLQTKLHEHGSAPWTEAVRVGIQIADALAAAHDEGILHRDVKPANVLTDRLGEYRLADFGIARFGEVSRTATGVITGTIAYTAPDVLAGARHSVQADLYSLGAMLHCLVTGKTPFVGDNDESLVTIMFRATTEPAPSLLSEGVPPLFAALVDGLMAKDPGRRPSSAIEVGQWFQKIQQENGLAVTPLRSAPNAQPAAPAGAAGYSGGVATPSPQSSTPPPSAYTPPPSAYTPPPTSYTPPSPHTPTSAYGPVSGPRTAGPSTPGPSTPGPSTPPPARIPPPPTGPTTGPGQGGPDSHPPAPIPQFIAPSYDATTSAGPSGSHSGHSGQFAQGTQASGPNRNVLIGAAAGVLLLIVIGVVIALAGGGDGKTDETTTTPSSEAAPTAYSAQVKEDWITLCTGANKGVSFCQCSYEEFEKDIPFAEYDRVIGLFGDDLDGYPGDFSSIFSTCGD